MRTIPLGPLAALVALALAAPAAAGVTSTPLPVLGGKKAKHVFTVPGVMKTTDLATLFICTVLDKKGATWGVEIFDLSGNLENDVAAGNGLRVVGQDETGTIGTDATAAYSVGDVITGLGGTEEPESARIVSTTGKMICSAMVVDLGADPPAFGYDLPVIKKTKQKGD